MILKAGVFLKQGIGILTASWSPVLLVITLDKWLHIFPLESKCEMLHETAAFNSFVMDSKKGVDLDIFTPIDPLMVNHFHDGDIEIEKLNRPARIGGGECFVLSAGFELRHSEVG